MKPIASFSGISRRALLSALALLPALSGTLSPTSAPAQTATLGGVLPSWNDGPAKQAIFDFVRATIDRSSPSYVFPEDRTPALYEEAKNKGWMVISMKNDWRRIFAFEQ